MNDFGGVSVCNCLYECVYEHVYVSMSVCLCVYFMSEYDCICDFWCVCECVMVYAHVQLSLLRMTLGCVRVSIVCLHMCDSVHMCGFCERGASLPL